MTATTTTSLPKNKTGIFAADTLQEVKPPRKQSITTPVYRNTASINLLFEQNNSSKNEIQPYFPINRSNSTTNDSHLNINGIRNGFRPSTIRRQKLRVTTPITTTPDLKDSSSKQSFTLSRASARLKSESDHINSQLKLNGDFNKVLRLQHNQDLRTTPQSALSYSSSCRLSSSASTNHTADRIHQRFSSALINGTLNALVSISDEIDTSNLSGIAVPSLPINEQENSRYDLNQYVTHAYRVPQQSNVGSESIFPSNSSTPVLTGTNSAKNNRRFNENKSASCPFYVLYFTNLAMQQRPNNNNNNENDRTSSLSISTTRKRMVNSRIGTSSSRHQSLQRQINSPIGTNNYSTIYDDNDDSMANITSYYNNKRFSAKIAAFENENSHLLKDVLRTTSWNHLQV